MFTNNIRWNDYIVDSVQTSMCLLLVLFSKRDDNFNLIVVFVHLFYFVSFCCFCFIFIEGEVLGTWVDAGEVDITALK